MSIITGHSLIRRDEDPSLDDASKFYISIESKQLSEAYDLVDVDRVVGEILGLFKIPPGVRLEGKQITLILKKDTELTNSINYVYIRRRNRRLRKIQMSTDYPLKRRMDRVLRVIRIIGDRLSLPQSEMETAAQVARRSLSKLKKKRWNNMALAAASIYYACRMSGNHKRMEDIVKQIGEDRMNKEEALKAYRQMEVYLRENQPYTSEYKTLKAVKEEMNLSKDVLDLSAKIIKAVEKAKIRVGKSPESVVAAAVYVAHKLIGKKANRIATPAYSREKIDKGSDLGLHGLFDRLYISLDDWKEVFRNYGIDMRRNFIDLKLTEAIVKKLL